MSITDDESYALILQFANALIKYERFSTAISFLEALREYKETPDHEVYRGLVMCHKALGQLAAAGEYIHLLRDSGARDLRSQALIVKHLEDTGKTEEATEMAKKLLRRHGAENILREAGASIPEVARHLRGRRGPYRVRDPRVIPGQIPLGSISEELLEALGIEPGQTLDWNIEHYRKLGLFMKRYGGEQIKAVAEAKQRDNMIKELGRHLDVLTALVDEGDQDAIPEYMEIAKIMVEDFKKCAAFFPSGDKKVDFNGFHVTRRGTAQDASTELSELANHLLDEHGMSVLHDSSIRLLISSRRVCPRRYRRS